VGSIRALKLHAWEVAFEERIAALRRKEVATLLHFQVLNAITPSLTLSLSLSLSLTLTLTLTLALTLTWSLTLTPTPQP
jgi:hypothetical protein